VHERESADLAATLIRQAVLAEGCFMQPLVLHADSHTIVTSYRQFDTNTI